MYDIEEAFAAIEEELIASMIRNLDRHSAWEEKEGFQWEQWQALQLQSLEQYKKRNKKKFTKKFNSINQHIETAIREARERGGFDQEIKILEAIKTGKFTARGKKGANAEFFKINDRKIDALIKATVNDMQKAETAILRMANDKYRQVIFNAQVYANSGAGTYEKAVDMATKDFLSSGLNCVEYKNGARHTLKDYADMALKTASKRAYLTGEGEKRAEWGIHTVIVNKRGNPCPKCLPFVGRVFIDDVWSGGSAKDGKHELLSSAIEKGFLHPRCKDSYTTYFPGITEPDDKFTKTEIKDVEAVNKAEAQKQYAKRQTDKFKRLAAFSLDPDNKTLYKSKADAWRKSAETGENIKSTTSAKVTTIKEAESIAKQYVYDAPDGTLGVLYDGISVESANAINEALEKIYSTYDLPKLNGIYVAERGSEIEKKLEGAVAGYLPSENMLCINRIAMGNPDEFKKVKAKELRVIEKYRTNPAAVKLKTKEAEEAVKKSLVSGRVTVSYHFEDVIYHEIGHVIEAVVKDAKVFDVIKANMSKYADKISGYATTDIGEYIAESFVSYMKGEKLIDPRLERVFELLKKA